MKLVIGKLVVDLFDCINIQTFVNDNVKKFCIPELYKKKTVTWDCRLISYIFYKVLELTKQMNVHILFKDKKKKNFTLVHGVRGEISNKILM